MDKKNWGMILLGAGAAILLISLTADMTGAGAFPEFGIKQIIGTIGGVIVVAVGAIVAFRE